ncbi:16S rRNA (guanine(966)-N(2))-methyltransferase RsmD [Pseudoxanthomonas daejeonensis]|uniref:Ribosomal RNA small subunit methyltransferase D n=1 Tax=Pseudoxanthomonas daejeonensis TaxID=266062 RepID=A0ABQ6Z9G6_9GAMM|nr:16S rRNA (guanine(966)-N(2))-methyltransferase RsmD [Pseudoxanthomonas daejeonensis]KAF1696278.1 16S rRNA (guanine(966)-N(2))-methyltransferase RsmD [Pseudoxanthomonas daejeonensis]UNK56952.1 16S rRNA (guanine(966)-N(2))-methyltransferase RsmD [Pseudoxanthomonas daejeonensis]
MNRPPRPRSATTARIAGNVRIVGGRWRGTRLPVPDIEGLRPTSDRVRETLFNWLQPVLAGSRVLDLFAGSGALGLEAVSRGAASAVLVERDPAQVAGLRAAVDRLQAGAQVQVVQDDALRWLAGQEPADVFDLAFIDPPFAAGLWHGALQASVARLAPDGWLYLESPSDQVPEIPAGWTLHRELRTAQARAALYRGPGQGRADTLPAADPAP